MQEPQLPLYQFVYPENDLLDVETWQSYEFRDELINFTVANRACTLLWVLLRFVPKGADLNWGAAARYVARKGDSKCLQLLLERVNPSTIITYVVNSTGQY